MSFNKITVVGNLGRDPEIKFTPQGQQVCEFSVATNEKKFINGESKDETTWFQVSLWGKLAETTSKYLSKGRLVYVEGRLRLREWTDREGRQRFSLDITGTELKFLGNQASETANNYNQQELTQENAVATAIITPQVAQVAQVAQSAALAPAPVIREDNLPKAKVASNQNAQAPKANGRARVNTVKDPFNV